MKSTQSYPGNPGSHQNLVTFRLGQQTFALPVEWVVQIIDMVAITPLPQVNGSVEGVINVRNTVVSVINLRLHFGLPSVPLRLHTPIILAQAGERRVGLIVDEVDDVLGLAGSQVTRTADILPQELGEVPLLRGLAHTPDGIVPLLDLEHLFSSGQVQALAQAVATLPDVGKKEAAEELAAER